MAEGAQHTSRSLARYKVAVLFVTHTLVADGLSVCWWLWWLLQDNGVGMPHDAIPDMFGRGMCSNTHAHPLMKHCSHSYIHTHNTLSLGGGIVVMQCWLAASMA